MHNKIKTTNETEKKNQSNAYLLNWSAKNTVNSEEQKNIWNINIFREKKMLNLEQRDIFQ